MVRLGNGSSRNVRRNYDPFSVEPFVISLNIGQDERIIEFNEQGELKVDGEIAIILNEEEDSLSDRPECLDKVDRYLRKTYWYYIRGADLVSHESTVTDVRSYFVLSYVNIVGTFLVLATCNEGDIINANTFVRLGSGGRPSALLHPNP